MMKLAALAVVVILALFAALGQPEQVVDEDEWVVVSTEVFLPAFQTEGGLATSAMIKDLEEEEEARRDLAEIFLLRLSLEIEHRWELVGLKSLEEWFDTDFSELVYNAQCLGAPIPEVNRLIDRLIDMAEEGKYHFRDLSLLKDRAELMKIPVSYRCMSSEF